MDTEKRNLFLAVVLSAGILLSFDALFPKFFRNTSVEPSKTTHTTPSPSQQSTPSQDIPVQNLSTPIDRPQALTQSPRVTFENPSLRGTFSLKGGIFDDCTLKNYRMTVAQSSPPVTLLNPMESHNGYSVFWGWKDAAGKMILPDDTTMWKISQGAHSLNPSSSITLSWSSPQGLSIEREIHMDNAYLFTVRHKITNNSAHPVTLTPVTRLVRHEHDALHADEKSMPLGLLDGTLKEFSNTAQPTETAEGETNWYGFSQRFWIVAIAPANQQKTHLSLTRHQDLWTLEGQHTPVTIEPGKSVDTTDYMVLGAKEIHQLDAYEKNPGIAKLDLCVDFGWLYVLAKPLFYLLSFIQRHFTHSFGWAIVVVTVLLKLAFVPLTLKSYKAMAHMRKVQPKIQQLQALYKDDKVRLQQEMIALYKKEKVNPASGCLPMVIQIPFFFALYKVLMTAMEMRHAPFLGWIQDLSAADPTNLFTLFGLLHWSPPSFMHIGLWPALMGATMALQQHLTPTPGVDSTQATLMKIVMPLMMTFLFGSLPVGLVIYWTWSNILSILQQIWMMRRYA